MATYINNAVVMGGNEEAVSQGCVIEVDFGKPEVEEVADLTMHGNLVYDMAEEEPEEDLLSDWEVYEAARRIDEERWFYRFVKRTFDVVFSALVLVVFCWLFALIAIAIKIDDPSGPVFFKQERVEQVIIRHNFGSCLLITIKAQLDNGFKLVLNKSKCAFGRKGRDFVSPAASMVVA